MPLRTITNPATGQTLQVADDYLSPETLSQFGQPPMQNQTPAAPIDLAQASPTPMPQQSQPPMPQPQETPIPPQPIPTPGRSMYRGASFENLRPEPTEAPAPENMGAEPDATSKKTPIFATQQKESQSLMGPTGSISDHGLSKAFDAEKSALSQLGQAQSDKALAEGKVYSEAQKQMGELEQNRIAMQNQFTQEMSKYENNIQELSKEASQTVDPRKYWKNKSGFGKVGAALAVLMGSVGTTINQASGGSMRGNAALDIIMDQIDEDIMAQRENIAQKGQAVRQEQNMYQMAMNKFQNENAAIEASRMAMIDQTKMRLAEMTANATSEEAAAKAQQANAILDQKKAESAIKLDQYAKAEAQKSALGMDRFVPGLGMTYDTQSAKDVRKFTSNYGLMKKLTKELISTRKKYGSQTLPGEIKTKLKSLSAQLQTLANQSVFELGALSGDDLKMIQKAIPDGDNYGYVLDAYETFSSTLDIKADEYYKTRVMNYQGLPEQDERFNPK